MVPILTRSEVRQYFNPYQVGVGFFACEFEFLGTMKFILYL